jgi:hypothetical protein
MTSDTTAWTLSLASGPSASLSLSINGGPLAQVRLKGVCYSPCPLNGANSNGPNLGDWFWQSFSGQGYGITGWHDLWARDLPQIRRMGANSIRVYSMLSRQLTDNGDYPQPWNSGHKFSHSSFLDQCWNGGQNPLYVLIGIPMPQPMFWYDQYQQWKQNAPHKITFWENVLQETVAEVANHPAVLGFIIQNEMDSPVVTYGQHPNSVPFWWSQVEKFAGVAATALGGAQKLIGMACHDDPNICGQAAAYMAKVPSLQFWGVNTYQTVNFNAVFDQMGPGPGYAGLSPPALKPVILTEWGMPATGHKNPADPSTIYSDAGTIKRAANVIASVVPTAYSQGLCLGLFYFEYSDEWWDQGGSRNIYTWYGGTPDPGFPNGFWDQEGFGLFWIERGIKSGRILPNNAPIWIQNGGYGEPNVIDQVKPRPDAINALRQAFPKT